MPNIKSTNAGTASKSAPRAAEPAAQVAGPPLHARIMRRPEVLRFTGLSTSTLYEMMNRGDFPRPLRLGKRAVGWPDNVVQDWIAARVEASL